MKKVIVIFVVCVLVVGVAGWWFMHAISVDPGRLVAWGLAHEDRILERLDLSAQERATAEMLTEIIAEAAQRDGVTRHYLFLLQNHMELRPGGGFLGQLATVSVRDGRVVDWAVRDANHLDREIKSDIIAPAPITKWLGIKKLNFRDANWALDFPENVDTITHLYNLSDTPETFDGVIAVNASLLDDVLAITGPVVVPGHEEWGAFDAENGLITLQDVVEKPFLLYEKRKECEARERATGIEEVCSIDPETGEKIKKITHADRENRKQILTDFALVLRDTWVAPLTTGGIRARIEYGEALLGDLLTLTHEALAGREMQVWMRDTHVQQELVERNWSFVMDGAWTGDYLAVADANMGALKTDYYIERKLDYTIDFTGTGLAINDAAAGRMVRYLTPEIQSQAFAGSYRSTRPLATMRMTYAHTAERENYRTSDYHAYTRLYTPLGSEWVVREWFFAPDVDDDAERDKTVFGYKYDIFIGDTLPTMLQYLLPPSITEEGYALKIQKQSGTEALPVVMRLITADGHEVTEEFTLQRDAIVRYDAQARSLSVEYL